MKILKRWTWDVWILPGSFAIDFKNKTIGVCIGPGALWLKWGLSVGEQFKADLELSRKQ